MKTTLHTLTYYRSDIVPFTVTAELCDSGIGIHVLGIPDEQIKTLLHRVFSALQSEGYAISSKKMLITISPDIPENVFVLDWKPQLCTSFDLAVALSILMARGEIPPVADERTAFFGTLDVTGTLLLPYNGHTYPSYEFVAEVLDFQARRGGFAEKIIGFPAYPIDAHVFEGAGTLSEVIEKLA